MIIYAFLKWLLVLGLLVAGAFFLATGLGVQIPLVEYKGLTAHGVPAGIALLVAGVALAVLWKITSTTTTTRNGIISTIVTTTTTFFRGPRD